MLQCDWPSVWDAEGREAVRVAIETAIRKAMAGSTNSQIRGLVNVDLPHLGASPPELTLSGIRELSINRTALMVKLRYTGDFAVTLRGLQINLDTIGSSGGEADANLALPFYCPFEMTLHDIVLDGMASIELLQTIGDSPAGGEAPTEEGSSAAGLTSGLWGRGGTSTGAWGERYPSPEPHRPWNPSRVANAQLLHGGRPLPAVGATSGYGVLLGAGGRRAMRPPEALAEETPHADSTRPLALSQGSRRSSSAGVLPSPAGEPNPASAGLAAGEVAGTGPAGGARAHRFSGLGAGAGGVDFGRAGAQGRHSISDLLSGKARVKERAIKVQLFGDPIKNFSVASNFASVPGANSKVEGTIKMLIKPTIDRMMKEGITISL